MAIRAEQMRNGRWIRYYESTTNETIRIDAPVFEKLHFQGKDIARSISTTGSGQIVKTITGAAPPTGNMVTDEPRGVLGMYLTNANQAQSVGFAFNGPNATTGAILPIRVTDCPYYEIYLKVKTLPTSGTVGLFGFASDWQEESSADNVDTVATNLWFKLAGSGAFVMESDNATTDNDDKSTGVTATADDQYRRLVLDAEVPTDCKGYIEGARVASSTTFTISVASGVLQPLWYVGKPAGTTVGEVEVDYVLWASD